MTEQEKRMYRIIIAHHNGMAILLHHGVRFLSCRLTQAQSRPRFRLIVNISEDLLQAMNDLLEGPFSKSRHR